MSLFMAEDSEQPNYRECRPSVRIVSISLYGRGVVSLTARDRAAYTSSRAYYRHRVLSEMGMSCVAAVPAPPLPQI